MFGNYENLAHGAVGILPAVRDLDGDRFQLLLTEAVVHNALDQLGFQEPQKPLFPVGQLTGAAAVPG